MPTRDWSRRDVLRQCLASGALLVPAGWAEAEALHAWLDAQSAHPPTPHCEMGPFYKSHAPDVSMLRAGGDRGMPLAVAGRVITVNGEVVAGARVEVWQADDEGLYDLEGFKYRATLSPGTAGTYRFDSVMPGHYPARVARHVHYFVTAPGYTPLTTQLYFATDEVFEGNPDRHYAKDPLITSRSLVRPVTLGGRPESPQAAVEFELVLEKA